jgi:TolA-binding protein
MEVEVSDLSPQAEALLEISRGGDDPTGRDRTRVRNALAGRIAIGVAAGAAVATISKTAATATATTSVATATVATAASAGVGAGAAAGVGISGLAAKLLLSAALVGAVGAGTVTYTQHRAEETRASSQVASLEATKQIPPSPLAPRPPSRTNVEAPVTNLTAEVAAPVPVEALPAAPAPTPRTASPIVASPVVAPSTPVIEAPVANPAPVEAPAKTSSLTEEIALLQDAHAALQSGSAARALGILDEHARRFPRGTLTEEREASRVSALCKLGRTDEARTQAADFLRDHPRSPQAPAVRASCAFDGK